MVSIRENVSLKQFNTFNIDARARYYCEVNSEAELLQLAPRLADFTKFMVLGGGSNVLFCGDYHGLVIRNCLRGREQQAAGEHVLLRLGAGENWHQCVQYAVSQQLYGMENLALIPGTVGAAPIQNIGAYGVELKDMFDSLTALNLTTGSMEIFDAERCRFAYRDSFFKQQGNDNYCITQIDLRLAKQGEIKTDYGEINAELAAQQLTKDQLTPAQMSNLICCIRQRKLPDPEQLPNAGSFFKNPLVSAAHHAELKARYPSLVSYPLADGNYKLACGWLIDNLGWKGKALNGAKVHDRQALVLINQGGGAVAIIQLAERIQRDVKNAYGVELEPEPRWIR